MSLKKVLLVNDDKNTEVGNPTVEGALVEGLVLDNIKDRKILVFKKEEDKTLEKNMGIDNIFQKSRLLKFYPKVEK